MTNLTAVEQQRIRSRESLAYSTNTLLTNLQAYVAQGGDVGFFTGKTEEIKNKLGQTGNKELASLGTQIADTLDILARERTGAALTTSEEAFYRRLLPSVGKTMEYNQGIVDGLKKTMQNNNAYIDSQIEKKVQGKAKELYYAPNADTERDSNDFSKWMNSSSTKGFVVD